MSNFSKPNVKVNLGPKILNYETTLNDLNSKINELSSQLSYKADENYKIKKDFENLKIEFQNQTNCNLKQEIEIKDLNLRLSSINKEVDTFNISTVENQSSKLENLKSIKYLKLEIDELSNSLNYYKDNKAKIEKEIHECDKIKSNFEVDNINLIDENNKLSSKVDTLNSILKQKEKYIEILMKEKNKIFKKNEILDSNKQSLKKPGKSHSIIEINNINSNLVLQNKIAEYDKILEEKEKIIKILEFEKMNLMNRI